MKRILFVTLCALASFAASAQVAAVDEHAGHNHGPVAANTTAQPVAIQAAPAPAPEALAAKEEVYDFGKIPQGKPVTHVFEVTNIGKTAFKLDNVTASCGCTTPEWDKEKVINAGENAPIKVGYNAAAEGPFTKPVTITYNGNQTKVITIKGTVWKTPAASAPANTGLNDLKN